jgi:hypothetical protein
LTWENGPCITGPPVLRQLRGDRLGSWWDTAAAGVASGASWGLRPLMWCSMFALVSVAS